MLSKTNSVNPEYSSLGIASGARSVWVTWVMLVVLVIVVYLLPLLPGVAPFVADECTSVTNATSVGDCFGLARAASITGYLYVLVLVVLSCVSAYLRAGRGSTCSCIGYAVIIAMAALLVATAFVWSPRWWLSEEVRNACEGSPTSPSPIDCVDQTDGHMAVLGSILIFILFGYGWYACACWAQPEPGDFGKVVGCACVPLWVGGTYALTLGDVLTHAGRAVAATAIVVGAMAAIVLIQSAVSSVHENVAQSEVQHERAKLLNALFEQQPNQNEHNPRVYRSPSDVCGPMLWAVLCWFTLLRVVVLSDDPYPRIPFANESVLIACADVRANANRTQIDCWQLARPFARQSGAAVVLIGFGCACFAEVLRFFCARDANAQIMSARSYYALWLLVVPFAAFFVVQQLWNAQGNEHDYLLGWIALAILLLLTLGVWCICICWCICRCICWCICNCNCEYSIERHFDRVAFPIALSTFFALCAVASDTFETANDMSIHAWHERAACTGPQPNQANPQATPVNCWKVVRPEMAGGAAYTFAVLGCVYGKICMREWYDSSGRFGLFVRLDWYDELVLISLGVSHLFAPPDDDLDQLSEAARPGLWTGWSFVPVLTAVVVYSLWVKTSMRIDEQ